MHQEFVPRRLIKIGTGRDGLHLSLYEATKPVEYACLSYRWGTLTSSILTTKKTNVAAFRDCMSLHQLPRTIQDAVSLCHGIGLRYLWVDSLCIIQDDIVDWNRESPQMLKIYANSHLTIYATTAESCNEGFLGPQRFSETRWQRPVQTKIPPNLELPGSGLAVRTTEEGATREPENVLGQRAWCLQEELLPNRRLYFNGYQMRWECGERHIQECNYRKPDIGSFKPELSYQWKHILGYSGEVHIRDKVLKRSRDVGSDAAQFGDDLEFNTFQEWTRIVKDYSQRRLSFSSDKLVALAGVAELIGQATESQRGEPDPYLAGLWESSLMAGLSWTAGSWEFICRQEDYRAPTWSWAAMDGPVQFRLWQEVTPWKHQPTFIPQSRLLSSFIQPVSQSSPFGRVRFGYIELVGPLVPVEVMTTPNGRKGQMESKVRAKNLYSYKVYLDYPAGLHLTKAEDSYGCWMKRSCQVGCCKWKDDKPLDGGQFFCLQLFTWECRSRTPDPRLYYNGIAPITWFLVLKRGQRESDYERVGVGQGLARKDVEWAKIGNGMQEAKRFECPLFAEAEDASVKII